MKPRLSNNGRRAREWMLLIFALMIAAFVATAAHAAAPAAQKTFGSPEEAVDALIKALKAHDKAAIQGIVGNAGDWISSGDAVADRATADRFVAAYDAKHSITREGDAAKLVVGDDYPFAFPIVKAGERWRFDTDAGKDELLARRIGRNELYVINVLQAIVDAEREYASADRNGDGVFSYAQKFASSPGKRDGLYWPVKTGEPPSPLGELVADASSQGYKKKDSGPTPFHGYYYRMLKGQTKNAASGALDYVVKGRAIGGFAVVAYPARYANSGIMTFIVNQDGKVYEADLGPSTQAKASAMERFDPGKGWSEVKVP